MVNRAWITAPCWLFIRGGARNEDKLATVVDLRYSHSNGRVALSVDFGTINTENEVPAKDAATLEVRETGVNGVMALQASSSLVGLDGESYGPLSRQGVRWGRIIFLL